MPSCDRCGAVAWTAVAFVVLVASTTIVVDAAGQVHGGFATVAVLDHPFTLTNFNPPSNGAMFGVALDVHQGRLVVTSLIGEAGVVSGPGSAYYYRFEPKESTVMLVNVADAPARPEYGYGVSAAVFGDRAVVGSDRDGLGTFGSVFCFGWAETDGPLVLRNKVFSPFPSTDALFGAAVDLDHDWLLVGAPTDDGATDEAGAVYLFPAEAGSPDSGFNSSGCQVFASDAAAGAHFGGSVALANGWAVVGADMDSGRTGDEAGSVYLFRLNTTSRCLEETSKIEPPDAETYAHFGSAVSVAGSFVAIGADTFDGIFKVDVGQAYVYQINATSASLDYVTTLLPLPSLQPGDGFGSSVAINEEGVALVGAPKALGQHGGVYIFSASSAGQFGIDGLLNGEFAGIGASVALSGRDMAFGAPLVDYGEFRTIGKAVIGKAAGDLVVDEAYCEPRGGAFSGECVGHAIAEANAYGLAPSVLLSPGLYTGCPDFGEITRSGLLISTTAYPNLPPADQPDVIWTCGHEEGARHLRFSVGTGITVAGIGFVESTSDSIGGAVARLKDGAGVAFDSCYFAHNRAGAEGGGAISGRLGSVVNVTNSVAFNCSATSTGGFVSVDNGGLSVVNTTVTATSARLGGAIYALSRDYDFVVDGVFIESARATVSGGAIFVDAGSPSSTMTIANTAVIASEAAAVGGGIAVRAARLVEEVGVRRIAMTNLTVTGNVAHRGGGIYSEIDTIITASNVTGNLAAESGGGAVFQPSPCLSATVLISASHFVANRANASGGAVYGLTADLSIATTTFDSNVATRGGAVSVDCEAEICVGQLPRDTCATLSTTVSDSVFSGNAALAEGGAFVVANALLALDDGGSLFNNQDAARGAVAFFELSAAVTVGGAAYDSAMPVGWAGPTNQAVEYGDFLASPPASAQFVAIELHSAMAGENVCPSAGCRARLLDAFGNVPTLPMVVQVVAEGNASAVLDGAGYLLVAGGESEPIPDLGVRLAGDPMSLPAIESIAVGLRFDGGVVGLQQPELIQVRSCDAGFGVVVSAGDDTVGCARCATGNYSATLSWNACDACGTGTWTAPEGGATSCDWCASGYGWDEGEGVCVPCAAGQFAPGPSLHQPCSFCDNGLTTDGPGANSCAVVVGGGVTGGTPWWVWVLIGVAVLIVIAVVAAVAWRGSRRKVISHYYIDEDATVTIDDKLLSRKINKMLQNGFSKRIGGGEFTDIYRVREGKDVFVLKLLKVNLEGSGTARAEFDAEARILAQLQARIHPGVIRARFFTSSSPVCIGLDYCAGGTLKEYLARSGISPKDKLMFATQIASSMSYIHSKGIAHLDLKTTNILLTADKRSTVIADFGISQTRHVKDAAFASSNPVFDAVGSGGGGVGGGFEMMPLGATSSGGSPQAFTPHYCPPERILRKDLTFDELQAADVYSYGVVTWVIYSQVEPFAGVSGDDVIAAIRADPRARHEVPAWTDAVAARVIERCWAADGSHRPSFPQIENELGAHYCGNEVGGEAVDVYAGLC